MKIPGIILLFLCSFGNLYAREYPKCRYTYYHNGRVSTKECYDTLRHWGRATAYNPLGKEIYSREIRRIAGHASVAFSFYPNGGVKKAEYSSAPDAGIQWYRTYTSFAEDGTVTSEVHDGYDKGPGTTLLHNPSHIPATPPAIVPPKRPKDTSQQTTMECGVIYSSEFWFKNTTPYTVVVSAVRKGSKSETYILTLRPRQSMKAGQMIGAQQFNVPATYFDFSVRPLKESVRQKLIILPADTKPEQVQKDVMRYYYDVRRII
jgi:hypothetical protein